MRDAMNAAFEALIASCLAGLHEAFDLELLTLGT